MYITTLLYTTPFDISPTNKTSEFPCIDEISGSFFSNTVYAIKFVNAILLISKSHKYYYAKYQKTNKTIWMVTSRWGYPEGSWHKRNQMPTGQGGDHTRL